MKRSAIKYTLRPVRTRTGRGAADVENVAVAIRGRGPGRMRASLSTFGLIARDQVVGGMEIGEITEP